MSRMFWLEQQQRNNIAAFFWPTDAGFVSSRDIHV